MAVSVRVESHALSPEQELAAFSSGRATDGAVLSFTGLTRATGHDGAPVSSLKLDWYPGMTEGSMQAIGEAVAVRFEISDVLIVHRAGEIAAGDPVVFAAVAAPHRRAAFEALDYVMDRLKTEAAFWKQETGPSGARRIEPTARDAKDRARWSD